jgi:hypothetical protein
MLVLNHFRNENGCRSYVEKKILLEQNNQKELLKYYIENNPEFNQAHIYVKVTSKRMISNISERIPDEKLKVYLGYTPVYREPSLSQEP